MQHRATSCNMVAKRVQPVGFNMLDDVALTCCIGVDQIAEVIPHHTEHAVLGKTTKGSRRQKSDFSDFRQFLSLVRSRYVYLAIYF